jgi:hypothetical protein
MHQQLCFPLGILWPDDQIFGRCRHVHGLSALEREISANEFLDKSINGSREMHVNFDPSIILPRNLKKTHHSRSTLSS